MDIVIFDWLPLLRDFGPVIGVLIFFVWKDWRREDRLSGRVEKLETYQKETLALLVEKSTESIAQSSEIIKWVGRILERVPTECPYVESPRQEPPGH